VGCKNRRPGLGTVRARHTGLPRHKRPHTDFCAHEHLQSRTVRCLLSLLARPTLSHPRCDTTKIAPLPAASWQLLPGGWKTSERMPPLSTFALPSSCIAGKRPTLHDQTGGFARQTSMGGVRVRRRKSSNCPNHRHPLRGQAPPFAQVPQARELLQQGVPSIHPCLNRPKSE
jgi:hypothetical protein